MKKLFDYSQHVLLILALVAVAFMSCDNGEEEPEDGQDPTELPELADLVGRWGISQIQSGGNTDNTVPCKNTLEIDASGNFLFVDVARANWLEGNLAFDASDSSLTLTTSEQTLNLKLLEIADGSFQLQFEDNAAGTVTISTQIFTALEASDCAAFTNDELTNKWSIHSFTREIYELHGDDIGTLADTETVENLTENTFTIDFRTDGTAINIDYINEYTYQMGRFETLNDHNLVIDFDTEDDEAGALVHLESVQWPYWIFESVEFDEDESTGEQRRIVSRFTVAQNSENVATIDNSALMGKWSFSSFSEAGYLDGQEVFSEMREGLPANKMTIEFTEDQGIQMIDLLGDVGVRQGNYEFLDASNLLITMLDENEESEDEEPLHLFLRQNTDGERIVLFNAERFDEGDSGDGTDHEADLETMEFALEKNTGQEAGISSEELIGQWQVTEVETIDDPNAGSGEGPQVGMVIEFESDGSAHVTFDQQVVTRMDFDFLDRSNLMVVFENESGSANDDPDMNIFHVNDRPGGNLELVIYAPSEGGDGDDPTGTEPDGGALFRLVMKKL